MRSNDDPTTHELTKRWIAACAGAEGLSIAIAALAMHTAHAAESPSAWLWFAGIGVLEGTLLGAFQYAVLQRRFPSLRARDWTGMTAAVATLGWLAAALYRVPASPGSTGDAPTLDMLVGGAVVLGGFAGAALGAAQTIVLRHHARHAKRWILGNAAGWALAMPILFVGATLPEADSGVAVVAAIGVMSGLCAGATLGLVTSVCFRGLAPWVDEQRWSLAGKVFAVTGANRGIGLEVAKSLARMHGTVVLLCRDVAAGNRAVREIRDACPNAEVACIQLDLGSLRSVGRAARELRDRYDRLDVLIHNAGATFRARTLSGDGVEATLAVDALGPFALTVSLLDRLAAARGRVIQLAGISYRRGELALDDLEFDHRPYAWSAANGQAQLARVVFGAELARRVHEIFVASVHPGAVWTSLPDALAGTPLAWLHRFARPAFVRAAIGAMPVVRLAAEPGAGATPSPSHPLSESGRFFDRYRRTRELPDALLCDLLWAKFEELAKIHGPPGVSIEPRSSGRAMPC